MAMESLCNFNFKHHFSFRDCSAHSLYHPNLTFFGNPLSCRSHWLFILLSLCPSCPQLFSIESRVHYSALSSPLNPSTILCLYFICLSEHPLWLIPTLFLFYSCTRQAEGVWRESPFPSPVLPPPHTVTSMFMSLPLNLWPWPCDS